MNLPSQYTFYPQYVVLGIIVILTLWVLAFPIRKSIASMRGAVRYQLFVITGLGICTRLLLSPIGHAPVPDILATRLLLTEGTQSPHPIYGAGIATLGRAWNYLTQSGPTGWFWLQLFLACLVPPLVWYIARCIAKEEEKSNAALFAGLLAAILPTHVMLSGSVLEHTAISTFCIAAVAAWLGSYRNPRTILGILAGLLAGFAAHIRPEILPFTLLVGLGLFFGSAKGRSIRFIGGFLCIALLAWRAVELSEKEFQIAKRVLFTTREDGATTLWNFLIGSSWIDPIHKPSNFLNVFSNVYLVPVGAWLISLCGITLLIKRKSLIVPLCWLSLYIPVSLRGSPLSDALRLQLPSMVFAVVLFGIGCSFLFRHHYLQKGFVVLFCALSAPLLYRDSQPWIAKQILPILQENVPKAPKNTWLLIPKFNHYAEKEIELAQLFASADQKIRTRSVSSNTTLPKGELWLWWPIQCHENLVQSNMMKRVDLESCQRFLQCELETISESYLKGRVDTRWSIPEEGVRVGWYKILSCPETP